MPVPPSRNSYLESSILTASQPQLQLMLLEGAIRFCRQTRQAWEESTPEAERLLDKALDVVETLVHGVRGGETEIAERLEEQYAFLYRELVVCRIQQDTERLDVVLGLLEYERDTWKEACARCEAEDGSTDPLRKPEDETVQAGITAPLANMGLLDSGASLSLEA